MRNNGNGGVCANAANNSCTAIAAFQLISDYGIAISNLKFNSSTAITNGYSVSYTDTSNNNTYAVTVTCAEPEAYGPMGGTTGEYSISINGSAMITATPVPATIQTPEAVQATTTNGEIPAGLALQAAQAQSTPIPAGVSVSGTVATQTDVTKKATQ